MTVAANDITGRNDAPEFLRITAQWMRIKDSGAQAVPVPTKTRGQRGRAYKWSTVWADVYGHRVRFTSMTVLARFVGADIVAMSKHRQRATRFGRSEAVTRGKRWGWLD